MWPRATPLPSSTETLAIAVDTVQFNSTLPMPTTPVQRSYLAAPSAAGARSQPAAAAVPMELGAVSVGARGLKPLTDTERQELRKQGACFRCRQPGHLAKDCPAKGNGKWQ
jgi:hypothetical protein